IPAGKTIGTPIHLLFISNPAEPGSASHPRNLILVGDRAQSTVFESYVSVSGAAAVTNAVTEISVGTEARFEHIKVQDENPATYHIAAIHANLGRNSNSILHSIATGAKLSRNNIRTRLSGEGLECTLNGLYLTKDDQLADHHMIVEHAE